MRDQLDYGISEQKVKQDISQFYKIQTDFYKFKLNNLRTRNSDMITYENLDS